MHQNIQGRKKKAFSPKILIKNIHLAVWGKMISFVYNTYGYSEKMISYYGQTRMTDHLCCEPNPHMYLHILHFSLVFTGVHVYHLPDMTYFTISKSARAVRSARYKVQC